MAVGWIDEEEDYIVRDGGDCNGGVNGDFGFGVALDEFLGAEDDENNVEWGGGVGAERMGLGVGVGEGGADGAGNDADDGYEEQEFFVLSEEFFDAVIDCPDDGDDGEGAEHAKKADGVARIGVAGEEEENWVEKFGEIVEKAADAGEKVGLVEDAELAGAGVAVFEGEEEDDEGERDEEGEDEVDNEIFEIDDFLFFEVDDAGEIEDGGGDGGG